MSKFTWVLLLVVIISIFALTGYLNATGYFTQTSDGTNCREIQETYTDYVDVETDECETISFTEYGCGEKPLEFASDIDELDCKKECIEDVTACIMKDEDGNCIKWKYGVCDEYKLTCKFGITNLDDESGTWKVQWYRECLPDQPNCEEKPDKIGTYYFPLNSEQIKSSKVSRSFEAGAEETIWAEFIEVPTREFCGNLEKTREDCETATKQEPVEKTRTIMVCD